MASTEIQQLLKKTTLSIADVEYILRFIQAQNYSPQVVMRKVKLVEELEARIAGGSAEAMTDPEDIKRLQNEIMRLKRDLDEEKSKSGDLMSDEDVFLEMERLTEAQVAFEREKRAWVKERSSLTNKLQSLGGDSSDSSALLDNLKRQNAQLSALGVKIRNAIMGLRINLTTLGTTNRPIKKLLDMLAEALDMVQIGQEPANISYTLKDLPVATSGGRAPAPSPDPVNIIDVMNPLVSDLSMIGIQNPDLVPLCDDIVKSMQKLAKGNPHSSIKFKLPKVAPVVSKSPTKVDVATSVGSDLMDELEDISSPVTKTISTAPKAKPIEKAKPKPVKKKKTGKVSCEPREEKVLRIFIEYLSDADTDASFLTRVTALVEEDETYMTLGSLAMSQLYSYQNRGLEKQQEVIELIESWIENGIPR